jgi:hypothetical protein
MGRAEEARGNAAEPSRGGPLARSDRAGILTGDVPERPPERAEARPSGLEGDLGDGEVGVAEQRLCPFDAPREQVPMRWNAEGLLERSGEVGLGNPAHAGEPPDWPLLVRGGVHPVLRAQQAAQQLGILLGMTRAHNASGCPGMREQRAARRQPNAPDEMAAWRLLADSRMANEATRVNEGEVRLWSPESQAAVAEVATRVDLSRVRTLAYLLPPAATSSRTSRQSSHVAAQSPRLSVCRAFYLMGVFAGSSRLAITLLPA